MEHSTRRFRLVTRLTGGAIAVLGLVVIAAWHAHAVTVLQPQPGLIAPVYNTALSFLACGIGLVAIAAGRPALALPCGALAGVFGVLNVAQHAFGVSLGIDQLFMEHFITTKTSHPGRMAPNTAACFVLAAAALALEGTRWRGRRRAPVVGILGSIVVALGTVALSGYFLGVKTYGWGSFLPMAPQTAAGCAVLGASLMAVAWDEGGGDRGTAPRWLPIPVGLAGLTATVCLWQPLVAQGHAQIERTVEAERDAARGALAASLEARAFALLALAGRDAPAPADFERDARLVTGHFGDVEAIERVDPAGVGAGRGLPGDPRRLQVLRAAWERREVRFLVAHGGAAPGPLLLAGVPGDAAGAILGVIRLGDLCAASLPHDVAPSMVIVVSDAAGELYDRDADDRRLAGEWGRDGDVESHGLSWRVRVWPRAEAFARWRSSVPEAVMTVGGLFSVVFAVSVRLAQVSRLRALEVESTNRRLGSEVAERALAERSLRTTTDNLNQTLDEIRRAVAVLASTSTELLASMSQQAAGLQEQVAAVVETVTTIEEMARTSEQASQQARAVDTTIQRTMKIGHSGRQAVEDSSRALGDVKEQVEATADTILRLAQKAQAIGEIIATVNEIAEQTNVLALNASIEASRAGAQGAGFAVVAREVKALADQSKKATVQVGRILGDIQQATHTSVLAAEEVSKGVADAIRMNSHAGEAIRTLAEALAEAARAVTQVVAASTQEALGMAQVSEAMKSIEQVERRNDAALRQLERAAQDLKALSTRLSVLATA